MQPPTFTPYAAPPLSRFHSTTRAHVARRDATLVVTNFRFSKRRQLFSLSSSSLSFGSPGFEISGRYYENGAALLEDVPVYGKRLTNPWSHHHPPQPQQQPSTDSSSPYCWYHPLHSSSGSIQGLGHRHTHAHGHAHGQTHGHAHGHSQGDGSSSISAGTVQINQMNAFSGSHHLARQQQQQQQQQIGHVQTQNGTLDDEWKNIHMMLNCILGMVEKTKKALAILQTRGCFAASTPAPPLASTSTVSAQNGGSAGTTAASNNPSSTNGSQVESSSGDREGSLKRLSGEIVAQTIRAIEDKVAEVKRKDGWYFVFFSFFVRLRLEQLLVIGVRRQLHFQVILY